VPARKKQPAEDGTPPAASRKKSATTARKTSKAPATSAGNGSKHKQDLVIVESPAKAKTINKYLGSNFKVLASYGHVRDLPRRRRRGEVIAGVDIDKGWVPTYVVVDRAESNGKGMSRRRTAKDILAELKREAAKSGHIYLATDPDREGEAIAWHIEDALGLDDDPRVFRITFNEITRAAVQKAIAQPGKIDMDRVHAQEARRILDRVVGYPLSNLLSKKVARRSSAGRVQSVALRLVVDREREIEAFVPSEYWKIIALLAPGGTVGIAPKPLSIMLARLKEASRVASAPREELASGVVPGGVGRVGWQEVRGRQRGDGGTDRSCPRSSELRCRQAGAEGPQRAAASAVHHERLAAASIPASALQR